MKRWRVETRVTSRSIYFVDAEDEKAAEEASCNTSPDFTEDENEETMSITDTGEAPALTVKDGGAAS